METGRRILCEPCLDRLNTITAKDMDTASNNVGIANIKGNSGMVGVGVGRGVACGDVGFGCDTLKIHVGSWIDAFERSYIDKSGYESVLFSFMT